jgi:shikimate dehydrogenase
MKEVYTLEDLQSRQRLDAGAAKPARLAVLGHPISHSASPKMHQAALDAAGIDLRYIRIDVAPAELGEAVERLRLLGFIGCNVTVPHKLEVMDFCQVDPNAVTLGAVNTLHFEGDRCHGYNTDGRGFSNAIQTSFQLSFDGLRMALIGAGGGAGQAIAMQSCLLGVRRLVLVNRTLEKLFQLEARLRLVNPELEIVLLALDNTSLAAASLSCDLIVNSSSVGLRTEDESVLSAGCLKPSHCVYDTIYQPPLTGLLKIANAQGCRTANGLSMLLQQGSLAFQQWFPNLQPLAQMAQALQNA